MLAVHKFSGAHPAVSVISATGIVNGRDQLGDVRRVRVLRNAVTEVEDMTWAATESREDRFRFAPDPLRRAEQHGRVEIALQRYATADALARFVNVHRPVETDGVRA